MLELDITKKNPMMSFIIGAGVAYFTYYLLYVVRKPILACNDAYRQFLHKYLPISTSKFWPTFWCLETRAQTILRSLYKSIPPIKYERELLDTPDGGVVALDWMDAPASQHKDGASRPTVIVLPGLTGSSAESYALHFVQEAKQLGYRSVVFNNRGNGGAELKTPRTYNATNTDDLMMVIKHIKARYPHAPLIGVGVSLGGLILANHLAKTGRDCGLVAGMCVSAAWNVFESAKTLEEPLNKFLFNRLLTNNLVENVRRYEELFRQMDVDMEHVYGSKTIRDFDERFTSKVFGYKTYKEYYIDACIHDKLDLIEIPLLCLNAADDVFSPKHAIPIQTAQKSRYVCIMVTQHGGHIGFLEGINPRGRNYMDRVYAQFIDAIFKHGDELERML